MSKRTVGVIFGGRSVEHDVSIVTGHQVMSSLDPAKYEISPIYITRDGRWLTGNSLRDIKNLVRDQVSGTQPAILPPSTDLPGLLSPPLVGFFNKNDLRNLDVVFPALHGSHGEDGTIQGLCELVNVPYVGAGVLASAIANDKVMTKTILESHGLPVTRYLSFTRSEWQQDSQNIINLIADYVGYPAFIKPVTLGSSIGVARVKNPDDAALSISIAINLDRRVMIDQIVIREKLMEVNCAVLGNDTFRASTLEQPISDEEFLTYESKYLRGNKNIKNQNRILPAPLADDLTHRIQEAAIQSFKVIQGRGTARIDFFVSPETDEFWVNEINTMPGSLAYYLWEPEGLSLPALCDELIMLALEAQAEKNQNVYDYRTDLVARTANQS